MVVRSVLRSLSFSSGQCVSLIVTKATIQSKGGRKVLNEGYSIFLDAFFPLLFNAFSSIIAQKDREDVEQKLQRSCDDWL